MVTVRATVMVAAVLAWAPAEAGWQPPPEISGAPVDAWPSADGKVGVATTDRAYEILASNGGIATTLPNPAVTAWVDGNCLFEIDAFGAVTPSAGCSFSTLQGQISGTRIQRLRFVSGRWAAACARTIGSLDSQVVFSPAGQPSVWTIQNLFDEDCTRAIAALPKGNEAWFLMAATAKVPSVNNLLLYRGDTRMDAVQVGPTALAPLSVSLVDDPSSSTMRAWVVDSNFALHRSLIDTATMPTATFAGFSAVTTLPAEVAKVRSVSLYWSATERFGMAVMEETTTGMRQIYSAVPVSDPAAFGTLWRPVPITSHPGVPAGTVIEEVHCYAASTCAIRTDGTGPGSVVVYSNAQAPTLTAPNETLVEGQSFSFGPIATDLDGDAVFVTWTGLGNPGVYEPAVSDDGQTGEFLAPSPVPPLCIETWSYGLVATDGKANHAATGTAMFTVTRGPAKTPELTQATLTLDADGTPAQVTALAAVGEPEQPTFAWSPAVSGGVTMTQTGAIAEFTPPKHVCMEPFLEVEFFASAVNSCGASDTPAKLTVRVNPWGPPEPPFSVTDEIVPGGSTQTITPAREHFCHGAPPGLLPAVVTEWVLDSALPANVTLVPQLAAGMPTTANDLQVTSADACGSGSFQLITRNKVTPGGDSDESLLTVTIEPQLESLDSATLTIALDASGDLSGTSDVTLNCLDQRTLQAEFLVTDSAGVEHQRATVTVPGPWTLPAISTCAPTGFTLQATLLGTNGAVKSNTAAWTSEGTDDPVLGPLDATPLVTRCVGGGVIADATLIHATPSNACLGQQTEWTHVQGPATLSSGTGDTVTLHAQGDRWDDIVGQTATFTARGTAAGRSSGEGTVTTHGIPDAPFVEARVTVDPPLASDSAVVTVTVSLENTSDCAVDSARWAVALERLFFVPGSARVNGQRADAKEMDGRLLVNGVSLPPRGTATVAFAARPAMYGRTRAPGQLEIQNAAVSRQIDPGADLPVAGCGCGAQPGASSPWLLPLALALGTLALRSRRRSAAASPRPAAPPRARATRTP